MYFFKYTCIHGMKRCIRFIIHYVTHDYIVAFEKATFLKKRRIDVLTI